MSRWIEAAAILAAACSAATAGDVPPLGLGRSASSEEIAAWDIDVRPDGTGLPPGRGSVAEGEALYEAQCAGCHGDFGEGIGLNPPLAGGQGTLSDERPVKTVGSYWPYLSTLWDYTRRAMPYAAPHSLSVDETYALTAYVLYLNDLVSDDFVLTRANFGAITLPNAGGFVDDDRGATELSRFSGTPCMQNCRAPATITRRASALDVTPASESPQ